MAGNAAASASGLYAQDAFTIDRASRQVACPRGRTTAGRHERRSRQGLPVIRVRFSVLDRRPCPDRERCVGSPAATCRELRLRHHDEHHAIRAARTEQQTEAWKERDRVRAGVEGTISQGAGRSPRGGALWPGIDRRRPGAVRARPAWRTGPGER
ncbi:transposase [Nocardiopsis sp. CA-288880]|uniref:transposase n=1 Tax=Nocardiopsis sp. CA-288880 TaxID=3239995 RepID=UPI003D96576E